MTAASLMPQRTLGPNAADFKNALTLKREEDESIMHNLINKVIIPDPTPVDNYMIIGLSKGTIIFVQVDDLEAIYARFSVHHQQIE